MCEYSAAGWYLAGGRSGSIPPDEDSGWSEEVGDKALSGLQATAQMALLHESPFR